MQTYFANTRRFYCNIFHHLRYNICLKLTLHHDKNNPMSRSHMAQNTDRTMNLSDKINCYLFTAMPMLHSYIGE